VLYVFVVLVVAGLLLLILPPLIDQMIEFLTSYLPTFWDDVVEYSQSKFPQWIELARLKMTNPAIKRAVEAMASEGQEILSHALPSLRAAGGGVLGIFGFATHLAIVPVYLFFFLLSRGGGSRSLRDQLPFLSEGLRDDFVFLVHEFVGIVESFFRGQLIIGFIMGILLVIGFSIVGLKFALLLGLLIGMLNVVPYLGTIVGLALVIPTAFFQPNGGWKLVALVLLVKIIVQAVEGWFLTPKIMGQRTGLHPIMIIVAIFFWGTAFDGILGMVLAIPLTAFFVTVWRLMQRKYFKRVPAH
jgi:predicted PurR-regulated permease PerM